MLVGPSGCGKRTILRMIAGLEPISGGEIAINGRVVNDDPPRDRDIAMVFQDYALYPHMTVRQNLGFGLKMRGTPRAEIATAVAKTAEILQIQHLLDRKPKQLSGGQRQRVAIGRAIAREPALFLFDEPLSNLDAKLRVEMRTQIKRLHMAFDATSVYVTHDQTEAMTLADRIVALRDGRIEQVGTPDDLYAPPRQPLRRRLHRLADDELPRRRGSAADDGLCRSPPPAARRCRVPPARAERYRRTPGEPVVLGIRPEDLTNTWTDERREGAGVVPLDLAVEITEPLGADKLVFSRIGEARSSPASPPRLARRRLDDAPARPHATTCTCSIPRPASRSEPERFSAAPPARRGGPRRGPGPSSAARCR